MPQLIGLNGYAESGKDTTADFMEAWGKEQGHTVVREAFAKRLKESAARALGIFAHEVVFCESLKNIGDIEITFDGQPVKHLTGREYLQYYGTEAHRQVFDDDFWVDAVLPLGPDNKETMPNWWYNFYSSVNYETADFCVITDVRFPNEAERVKKLGGRVFEIVRGVKRDGNHASEQKLPEELVDLTIDNSGTLDELAQKVNTIMDDAVVLEAIVYGS